MISSINEHINTIEVKGGIIRMKSNEKSKQRTDIIAIFGAKEHNLKNINVEIPKNSLVVITGPSGSGKSSLALDVLYTEGKRRHMRVNSLVLSISQMWMLFRDYALQLP